MLLIDSPRPLFRTPSAVAEVRAFVSELRELRQERPQYAAQIDQEIATAMAWLASDLRRRP